MDQKRAAAALFALAACFACSTAAPTTGNQTALDLFEAPVEGCYYNFQHYGEGDRIMTNEPCLNCTCHNRMLMCYLRVCPFTKPIGQDCTVEKRADQCCPIVTCPDVPVDLLTSTSTSSPAEYGATGLGKLDKYGCSINGKYFPEGAKVPPTPNKPCEHCYCIHNMTTCVMQECTLHVDGCTPIYHKDVCCPIRYSCDHPEDEIPLLDDMTTTVRPTPGFLLTTTTMMPVTQATQDCIHDDKIFADGALIKTEKACEHCYCMKGDIVCVVQECGTPMENEGKNCTSLPPKHGQCCPDTYICEGDDTPTTGFYEETTTLSPPRRVGVEGSGYRNEPDELYTEIPSLEDTETEGSGEEQLLTTITSFDAVKDMPETTSKDFYQHSTEPQKEITVLDLTTEKGDQVDDNLVTTTPSTLSVGSTMLDSTQEKIDQGKDDNVMTTLLATKMPEVTTVIEDNLTQKQDDYKSEQKLTTKTLYLEPTEPSTTSGSVKVTSPEVTTKLSIDITDVDNMTPVDEEFIIATKLPDNTESINYTVEEGKTTIESTNIDESVPERETTTILTEYMTNSPITTSYQETTTLNVQENEILEEVSPARIPGEGDCLLNGVTFKNNTSVPNTDKCHSRCRCVSSIIKCDPIICTPPLEYMENMNDCQPIYDSPESCCPTYICSTKETIAPESHSQMSGTETPKPIIECLGDECHINQENGMQEKPTEHECGENGCITNDLSTLPQKDLNECINGNCDIKTVQHPVTDSQLCDRAEGCQVPVIKPCEGDNCKTEQNSHEHKDIQDKFEPNIEPCDNVNGCQVPVITPCKDNNCKSEFESPIHKEKEVQNKPEICNTKNGCDKQIDDRDDICNDENCRRKEYGEVDTHVQCSGTDCIQQETILPTVSDISTPKQEQVTEILIETTSKPDLDNISQDNDITMLENQSTIEPIKKLDTTEAPKTEETHIVTTSPDIQQSFEDFVTHQQEIVTLTPNLEIERITTVSSHADITDEDIQSTESSISRTDKTTTPILDAITTKEHLTAATENLPKTSKGYISEGTEKNTIEYTTSSESLTLDEINKEKITVIDIHETTTSDVMFTDKFRLEQTTHTEDNNIANEDTFSHVTKPHLEVKTTDNVVSEESVSTNVPQLLTSISQDGISSKYPEFDILTTKEISNMDLTVEPISEITKFAEITTEYSVTEQKESGQSTLSESTQSEEISTESPGPLGTNSIPTEISKPDVENVQSQVVDLTTAIQDNNEFEKATTPLVNEETTVHPALSEKVTDGQLDNEIATFPPHLDLEYYQTQKPISTEDLELFTGQDLLQTTQSIEMDIHREHSANSEIISTPLGETTHNIIDDKESITDVPEIYTEVPSYLTTDSKVYSTVKDTATVQSDFESTTKIPTLHKDSSEADHILEEQTEISNTIKPSISEEEIITSTESAKHIDTTLQELLVDKTITLESNNEDLEDGYRGTTEYQEQTTRKSTDSIFSSDSETKTSDEEKHQDEINTKTTPAYNKYDGVSKETTISILPSTSDTTESVSEITTQENTLIDISKVITTESSGKPIVNTDSLPKTDVPSKLNEDKPISTVFDQDDYSTTTVKNYENAQTLYDETKTEKKSDLYDEKKTSESIDSQFTKSYDHISTENTDIITAESITTPKPHDLGIKHELSSSTLSSIVSDKTEQDLKTTTNIIELKEKETEQPMSLVTEKQGIPETATENMQILKVTETNELEVTDRLSETGPYLHDEIGPKITTSTESFTTKQVDLINENMKTTSEVSTEIKYPKPTTELPKETIIYQDEQTTVQKMSSETSLIVDSEQPAVTEETSGELTTLYETDMSVTTSTTEKPQNETKIKPEILYMTTDERSEMSTELPDVQTEKEIYVTEIPISELGDQSTEAQKDISQSSSAPILPEAQDVTDKSLLIDEITKQPESLTTVIENADFTKNIVPVTEEPLSLTTEIHEQMSTSSEEQTSNVEKVYVDVLNPSTSTPYVMLSTIKSEKETEYETEIVTRAPEKSSDSNDNVESTEKQTTTAEIDVTKLIIPDTVSTEIPQESQTDQPTTVHDENSVVPVKPDSHVTQPQDTTVQHLSPSEIQTQAPEEFITNIYNENITFQDNINKEVITSTHKDAIITSTEQSDNKIMEHETKTETKYEYSETTPYFVELEEHTHQIMQESSVIPVGEISTVETTDIQPTERGDQSLTDKLSQDSETEKATEITEKPYGSYPVTTQISEELTSQETYKTTELPNEVHEISGSTETSLLEPQKGTGTSSLSKPESSYEDIVTTILPHIVQNEESNTMIPTETEKPSILEAEIMGSTQKFNNITEEKTQKPETIFTETITSDENNKSTTTRVVNEETTVTSVRTPVVDEKLHEILSTTIKPTLKPDFQPTEEVPEFPPSGVSGYGQEPDYGEEDQAFGPGTCRYGGKVYVSAQQIPRDDPCDFCFCFRSDIICLQQSCPPPIHGCHEEPIQGFCCPRYECPVSMATTLNVTTTTTTTTTTLPPHFLPHAYKGAAQKRGCHIKGQTYKVGEVVRASSGPCLHCTCGGDGQMKCDPKACTPEPMLRQMIAAAVSARRRR